MVPESSLAEQGSLEAATPASQATPNIASGPFAGYWAFRWSPSGGPLSGVLTVMEQDGNRVTGFLQVDGSPCAKLASAPGLPISGGVGGTHSLGVGSADPTVSFSWMGMADDAFQQANGTLSVSCQGAALNGDFIAVKHTR